MSLKKSDKIIAIIGVIILIGAGMGIFLYATTDEETDEPKDDQTGVDYYNIDYEPQDFDIMPLESKSIKPKLFGEKTESFEVEVDHQNIKSIKFFIEYNDNKKGILFGKMLTSIGADTLTVQIKDCEGNVIEGCPISIKGDSKKNKTVEISLGNIISLEPIEADSMSEAKSILKEKYVDFKETYTIKVSIKSPLWMKFRELLGQDTYKVEVTGQYYDYMIVEPEEPEEPEDDEGDNGETVYGNVGMYASTVLPGKL